MDITGKKLFKTAMFGGFKKSSVCEYITEIAKNHNAEILGLKEEIKAGEAANEELRHQIEKLQEQLEEAHGSIDKAKEENEEVKKQAGMLQEQVTVYADMEDEFNSNKSRLAELELSAIARASEIEQEASKKAEQLSEQAKSSYEQCKAEIAKMKRDAQVELNKTISDMKLYYSRLVSEVNNFSFKFDDLINNTKTNMQMLTKTTGGTDENFVALEKKLAEIFGEASAKE